MSSEAEELQLVPKDEKLIEQFKNYLNSITLCLFEFQSTNILSDDDNSHEISNVLNKFCFNSDVILMFMSMNRQNLTSKLLFHYTYFFCFTIDLLISTNVIIDLFILFMIVTLSLEGNVFSLGGGDNSIVALAKTQSSSGSNAAGSSGIITRDRPFASQVQIITLPSSSEGTNTNTSKDQPHPVVHTAVDGMTGERRILNSLQQYTKNFYTPLVRFASQAAVQDNTSGSTNDNLDSTGAHTNHETGSNTAIKGASGNGSSSSSIINENDLENLNLLQKKVRELDIVLEQCQRGAVIPSTNLLTQPSLQLIANKANVSVLKTHLEKYNVSQVDLYFTELGVTELIGKSVSSSNL